MEGENLVVELGNAQADPGMAALIADHFISEKVDMICAIATPSAATAYNAVMETNLPVIYTAVSDPVEPGWLTRTGALWEISPEPAMLLQWMHSFR